MMKKRLLLFAFVFTLMFSCFVSAETFVNVSITEQAFQNVSFAQFFVETNRMEENVTNKIVRGYVNVSNPSDEDVSDILVYLDNMSNLATNFSYMSGRLGYQILTVDESVDTHVYSNLNNTPRIMVDQDLDHDNRTDYFWVNHTHIIFDLSTEHNELAFFVDTAGQGGLLEAGVNFDQQGDITLSNGDVVGSWDFDYGVNPTPGEYIEVTITENTNEFVTLSIPEMRAGEYTLFNYTAVAVIDPPVNVETNYTHEQYTKVLAGECFNVTQSATNDFLYEYNLTGVNITMEAQGVTWNGSTYNFTLDSLQPGGDAGNVTFDPSDTDGTWYWVVGGSNMTWGETYNISFGVCAPESVPISESYIFLKETLLYQTRGTVSGLEVKDVKSVAKLASNFTKRIDRPATDQNETNVTWEVVPKIGTSQNVAFNVTKITMWVTENLNPNNLSTVGKELTDFPTYTTYYPKTLINDSFTWEAGSSEYWYFNYTDGSSFDSPPPIVWMYPYFHIADKDEQLVQNYLTESGEDLYWKYIYVVNGYWLEIEKNVTNVGEDSYNISVVVVNRGNGYTPRDLTVTVYDFVPGEFNAYAFDPSPHAQSRVFGQFNGTAYRWDIPPNRTTKNASFAPRGEPNSTWNMSYIANGTGDYRVSELFVVGLDPRLVDGGGSHETISVVSTMATHTTEMVYVGVVLFLVVLNITNFVITRNKEKETKGKK